MRYLNIVFIMLIFFSGCSKQTQLQKSPPKVIVCSVIEKKVNPSHTVVGEVIAEQKVELVPRVTGFLVKQNVQDGSFVKKGELLFQIQQEQYKAQVLSAEGNVQKAKSTLKNAQIEYNRQGILAKQQAVAQRNFDKAVANLGDAEGELKLAEASLVNAKLNLSYTSIMAPFNGKVGIVEYDIGTLLIRDKNPLATIVMIDPILVQFNITEQVLMNYMQEILQEKNKKNSPLSLFQKNINVKLVLSNGAKYPLSGKVAYIDNVVDPTTGSIIIRAEFNNPRRILIPGSYVKVILEKKTPVNVLYIPQDCIQQDQLGEYVFILDIDNKVKYQHVKVGSVYGEGIAITEGLKKGEKIVYQGVDKIRDGMVVSPKEVDVEDIIGGKEKGKEKEQSSRQEISKTVSKSSSIKNENDDTDTQAILSNSEVTSKTTDIKDDNQDTEILTAKQQ